MIAAVESIVIGEGTAVAEMVVIRDQDHVMDPALRIADSGFQSSAVRIGKYAWIGAKATVLRGVSV